MELASQNQKVLVLFSGGKDSVFALYKAISDGYEPIVLSFVNTQDQIQFTDAPEMDQQFWVEYLHLFDSYKKLSIKNSGLNSALIEQIVSIAQNENVQFIYTGDLGHPEGIDVLLRQQSQLKIVTPGRTYVESYGKKAYVNHLISLGFVMPIISVRSDAVRIVEVGKILSSEYIEYLESRGIDCTGEDGEFQTIVTKASFFEKCLYIDSYIIEALKGRDTKDYRYSVLKPKKFYTENN